MIAEEISIEQGCDDMARARSQRRAVHHQLICEGMHNQLLHPADEQQLAVVVVEVIEIELKSRMAKRKEK